MFPSHISMGSHTGRTAAQMAARETGFGAVEAYMHQGKLLALDLVVRLLENPLQVMI